MRNLIACSSLNGAIYKHLCYFYYNYVIGQVSANDDIQIDGAKSDSTNSICKSRLSDNFVEIYCKISMLDSLIPCGKMPGRGMP